MPVLHNLFKSISQTTLNKTIKWVLKTFVQTTFVLTTIVLTTFVLTTIVLTTSVVTTFVQATFCSTFDLTLFVQGALTNVCSKTTFVVIAFVLKVFVKAKFITF